MQFPAFSYSELGPSLAKVGVASSSLVSQSSLLCGGNDDPPAVERIAAALGGWVLAHLEAAGL